jgi:CheY-like chemotaxis protein
LFAHTPSIPDCDAGCGLAGETVLVAAVLILEPDPEVRSFYEAVIDRMGLSVADTSSLGRAVPIVDVVLLEPGSPEDLEVAQTLHDERPEVPIVCASIFPGDSNEIDCIAYLEKPFPLAQLQQALNTAVAGS